MEIRRKKKKNTMKGGGEKEREQNFEGETFYHGPKIEFLFGLTSIVDYIGHEGVRSTVRK